MPTKLTMFAATVPFLLAGCNGAFLGNLVVLGITVGIFLGTLSLGRSTEATRSAEASVSHTPPRS